MLTIVINMTIILYKVKMLMSNRLFYAVFCFISLALGGELYLLFRENTYITAFFEGNSLLQNMRMALGFLENDFLKFYFPDFLWAFSLCFGLCLIFDPKIQGIVICCAIPFIYGVLWEILQKQEIIKGTGDLADVIMYLVASIFAILLCLKRRNKNEKIN